MASKWEKGGLFLKCLLLFEYFNFTFKMCLEMKLQKSSIKCAFLSKSF